MTKDILNETVLKKLLKKQADGMQITVLDSCPSTNTYARQLAIKDPLQTAIVAARNQTAGRGRLGRSFFSPDGTGIYCSFLVPTTTALTDSLSLTCAASVAIMRAIRNLTGQQTEIKWVNDLLLNEKKVCGILTEAVTMGEHTSLIVGIGVNLRPMKFPPELEPVAGTLNQPTLSRAQLIAEIALGLLPFLNDPHDRSWLDDYRRHSCVFGKEILCIKNGISVPCIAEEIDENGRLIVRYPDESREILHSGEISIRFRH